jgi:hypothetical protein
LQAGTVVNIAQILSCLLGTLLNMPGNNENWEELYRQAVQELDYQKIVATRDAIAGRLRDLENNSDHHSERHRIEDALYALMLLDRDIEEG